MATCFPRVHLTVARDYASYPELVWGNVINTRTDILKMLARAGLAVDGEIEVSRFRIFTARRS